MSQSSHIEQLKPSDWERLREAAEKLEQTWREHGEADLASFLPPAEDSLYGPILEELVKTDLGIRRGHGQPVTLDFYLEKYPRLGNERTLPARLLYEEYRVLRLSGEPINLEHYRQRYPNQFAELQRLVSQQPIDPEGETNLASSSPAEQPPLPLGLQIGDTLSVGEGYHLIKRIGSGSFGEVWEVEAPGGFPAAMKIIRRTLDGEEAQRELRSLEVIKRLSHPHLLKTVAAWPLAERLVILMELADCTLRDRLQQCKATGAVGIPVAELLRYFQEAAEALDYLHGEKVLHRDVKPQNLLLCHGHVKVADFGLVRDQKQQRDSESLSGTPGYMAPEAWGRAPCFASDQYSLALTYAELRLGRWPYSTDEIPILAHLEGVPDLSRLGDTERGVLLRGLAKNWKDRFPNCQALVAALREALPGDLAKYDLRAAPPTRLMPRLETKNIRPGRKAEPGSLAAPPLGQIDTLNDPLEPASDLTGTLLPFGPSVPDGASSPGDGSVVSAEIAAAKSRKQAKKAAKTWQWLSLLAVVCLFMTGIAGAVWLIIHRPPSPTAPSTPTLPPPEPSFALLPLLAERVVVSAGSAKSLPIRIERKDGFEGAVKVTATIQGAGLQAGVTEIDSPNDQGDLPLHAAVDAGPSLRRVTVRATADGQSEKSISTEVMILPSGFEPKGNATPYPEKIVRRVGEKKVEVVFVLIRPEGNAAAPFYLMENKVSNGLFRAFAREDRKVSGDEDLPVFGVTRAEAADCATWLGGGRWGVLPSVQQLDLAFGYEDWLKARRNPVPKKKAPINRRPQGPRKITASEALSPYGIRDLDSNGREWTRDNRSWNGKQLAVLRGRSYTVPEPLTFTDLDEWNKNPELCPVQFPDHRSWTTGFRVVIEVPLGPGGG